MFTKLLSKYFLLGGGGESLQPTDNVRKHSLLSYLRYWIGIWCMLGMSTGVYADTACDDTNSSTFSYANTYCGCKVNNTTNGATLGVWNTDGTAASADNAGNTGTFCGKNSFTTPCAGSDASTIGALVNGDVLYIQNAADNKYYSCTWSTADNGFTSNHATAGQGVTGTPYTPTTPVGASSQSTVGIILAISGISVLSYAILRRRKIGIQNIR
ncbi:hypothetical protein QUF74_07180 [Candidatus Halobeggiatoa sp. HSG11]|nr:hypothetical protein [Candidatus Halobeggiatoa sp. HSG11]